MWQVVVGGGVSPHRLTITPPPTTTRHMGELCHKLCHKLWHYTYSSNRDRNNIKHSGMCNGNVITQSEKRAKAQDELKEVLGKDGHV